MYKYIFIYLLSAILLGEKNDDVSGVLHSYYISRTSDGSIINLPFRALDLKWQRYTDIMSINYHMALEYRMPTGSKTFFEIIDAKNFIWELRELYFTWQLPSMEIRLGKQIHTWGSVDANSPNDNLSAYDYYYMFSNGSEQKMGSYSIAGEYYYNDWKLGFYVSPFHHVSRLPINDSEFPIELPANPTNQQILSIKEPIEFAGDITKSFDKGDITFSYFNGYDKTFSPAGFNVWDNISHNSGQAKVDTVFSYRKTEVIGLGGIYFLEDITLRGDIAYFITEDRNIDFLQLDYLGNDMSPFEKTWLVDIRDGDSKIFNTKASYYQANLQFEYTLPYDIQILGQYIIYDTLQYQDDIGTINIDLPELQHEFTPSEYFMPGIGTGLAILSNEILLIEIMKPIYNDRMELSIKTMMDQVYSGALVEFGVNYSISQHVNSYFALTKIFEDNTQDEKYEFNNMKNFSNIRMELKYYF